MNYTLVQLILLFPLVLLTKIDFDDESKSKKVFIQVTTDNNNNYELKTDDDQFSSSISQISKNLLSSLPRPIKLYEDEFKLEIVVENNQTDDKPRKLQSGIALKYVNGTNSINLALEVAAQKGIAAMKTLYEEINPDLLRKGQLLSPSHPGAFLSKFSAPSEESENDERAAYATLSATKYFQKSYKLRTVEFGRQSFDAQVTFRQTSLEGLCPPRNAPICLNAALRYRTHDGTCNNHRHPRWGAAQMPFNRFLPPDYEDGIDSIRESVEGGPLSSARFVSLVVHGSKDGDAPVTLMLAHWGQLIDHDLTSTAQPRSINGSIPRCCGPDDSHPSCFPIKVPFDDPWLAPLKVRCLEFLRSAPSHRRDCSLAWREQTNQATSYIDASPVYSSSARISDNARIFRNGLLVFGRNRDDICLRGAISSSCIRAGDPRSSEQPGLLALHHVWVGEHNRIARELNSLNPHWSDEKVYQETRRIVGALFQHITYREFLPLVLGREVCRLFDLDLLNSGYYTKYDPHTNPTVANSFAAAAFRFGHSLVQGSYLRCDHNHNFIDNNVTLHEEFGKGDLENVESLHRLLRGMAAQKAQTRDEFITAELTNHLFQSGNFPFGLDLAAINIQRGRDHGIPRYTAWREPCGLSRIDRWEDLESIVGPGSTERMSHAYQSVHDIDLFVGGIAERPVIGGLVGPTFACIIAQQFSNLRKGDRFWYENSGFESSFTPAQLHSIRSVSLAQILCRAIGEGTFQPHIFIPHDVPGNERIPCGVGLLASIDLFPWLERDPFNEKLSPEFSVEHDELLTNLRPPEIENSKNITSIDRIDFIPNGSTGIQLVPDIINKNITKIHDKLDFKQKLRPQKVSETVHNKLGSKNHIAPLNEKGSNNELLVVPTLPGILLFNNIPVTISSILSSDDDQSKIRAKIHSRKVSTNPPPNRHFDRDMKFLTEKEKFSVILMKNKIKIMTSNDTLTGNQVDFKNDDNYSLTTDTQFMTTNTDPPTSTYPYNYEKTETWKNNKNDALMTVQVTSECNQEKDINENYVNMNKISDVTSTLESNIHNTERNFEEMEDQKETPRRIRRGLNRSSETDPLTNNRLDTLTSTGAYVNHSENRGEALPIEQEQVLARTILTTTVGTESLYTTHTRQNEQLHSPAVATTSAFRQNLQSEGVNTNNSTDQTETVTETKFLLTPTDSSEINAEQRTYAGSPNNKLTVIHKLNNKLDFSDIESNPTVMNASNMNFDSASTVPHVSRIGPPTTPKLSNEEVMVNNIPLMIRRNTQTKSNVLLVDVLRRIFSNNGGQGSGTLFITSHPNVRFNLTYMNSTEKLELRQNNVETIYGLHKRPPQKIVLESPESEEYEIEINIRPTMNKRPSSNGAVNYFENNFTNKYQVFSGGYDDQHKLSFTPFSQRKPSPTKPSSISLNANTKYKRQRTKPPTIIYVNEKEEAYSVSNKPSHHQQPNLLPSFVTIDASNNLGSSYYSTLGASSSSSSSSANYNGAVSASSSSSSNADGANAVAVASASSSGSFGSVSGSTSSSVGSGNNSPTFNVKIRPISSTPPGFFQPVSSSSSSSPSSSVPYKLVVSSKPVFSNNKYTNSPSSSSPFSPYSNRFSSTSLKPSTFSSTKFNNYYDNYQLLTSSQLTTSAFNLFSSPYNYKRSSDNNDINFRSDDILVTDSETDFYKPTTTYTMIDKNVDTDHDSTTRNIQYDKDGYLRPEYVTFDSVIDETNSNDKQINKMKINDDYVLPVLDRKNETDTENIPKNTKKLNTKLVYSDTIPRRSNIEILAEEIFPNQNNKTYTRKGTDPIAFAPINILTRPDRPDNWVFFNASGSRLLPPEPPELQSDSLTSKEFPKPMAGISAGVLKPVPVNSSTVSTKPMAIQNSNPRITNLTQHSV